jgi:uncharacterized protein YkwD
MKKHTAVKWKFVAAAIAALAALCAQSGSAFAWELRIRNDFGSNLDTVIVYYDDASGAWTTKGWYAVGANSSKTFNFKISKQEIYLFSSLVGTNITWGKGDLTRVIIWEKFAYRDGQECPPGKKRQSVKFTKYTAKNNVVDYRPGPAATSGPLKNAGGSPAPSPAKNAGGSPAPSPAKNAGDGKSGSVDFSALAGSLIQFINQERRAVGASGLRMDKDLMKAAARRASELIKKNSHQRPDGREWHTVIDEFGLEPVASAENIASRHDDSAREINKQFMNSPSHKKSMLNAAYTRVGVGVARDGRKYYWVELFAGEECAAKR